MVLHAGVGGTTPEADQSLPVWRGVSTGEGQGDLECRRAAGHKLSAHRVLCLCLCCGVCPLQLQNPSDEPMVTWEALSQASGMAPNTIRDCYKMMLPYLVVVSVAWGAHFCLSSYAEPGNSAPVSASLLASLVW